MLFRSGWEYKGYHVLHWQTRHACPRSLAVAPDPAPNEPDATPETPPDDVPADDGGGGDPDKKDDQDFLIPPERVGTGRTLSTVAIIAILYVSPFFVPMRILPDVYPTP